MTARLLGMGVDHEVRSAIDGDDEAPRMNRPRSPFAAAWPGDWLRPAR